MPLLLLVEDHADTRTMYAEFLRDLFDVSQAADGEEALRMGLINCLMPLAELEPYVREYAATIAANAPLTLRAAKLASTELLKDEDVRDLDTANRAVTACFDSEDYQEGRTAFLEKRKPVFKGR